MSLLNVDDDQRWVPTHVQVTVLRGRGLRAKGKHGTSDVYTIIQVGKEKFSTCVVEKTTAPEWKEECSFELLPGVLEADGRSAYPSGSGDLVLTVMHRALIGLDVFLGQAIIPLDRVFQERICMRNEWYKLNSKSGKKEKERGEVQVTVKFTRNNLTASMYDLSMKDKPRSTFGRLKDRMKGKKHNDSESASAVVPSSVGALSRQRARLPSDGGGEEDYEDDEGGEGRRSKMRNFFLRGKLRKSSDTRSSTSLGSESSESSSRGGSLSPTAGISVVVSDLSNSPSESSNLTADNSPEHTSHPSPKLVTHKRALSDEAGQITAPPPPQPHAVASLKAQSGVRSQSSLCINGSHVYAAEPLPHGSTATLGLLQKCSPLSRSLQNLTRRTDEPQRSTAGAEGRRWSFDKAGKEEKASALEPESRPVQPAAPAVPTATVAEPAAEGKKQKRNLFSHGWSDSAGKGAEQSHAPPPAEEKHKGWFGSKDSHNKPSPEVSPKVETSSDAVPSLPLTPSPDNPSCARPPASAIGPASPGLARHANPFTPPPVTPTISPSNPFFTRLQCNPFFVELLGDHALNSAPPAPCLSSSPLWPLTVSSSWSDPSPAQDSLGEERGHDVAMARERSHLGVLGTSARGSPNPFVTSPVSENLSEWDESFEAFAASRLGSWKGPPPPARITTALSLQTGTGQILEGMKMQEKSMAVENASPTLLRRPTKIPVLHGRQNHRYDWTQEPGLKKDLFLPPKTDVASPQFVSMCSLIPKSASAGQPIASPYSKDFGETGRGGARSPAGQEDGPRASATVLHTAEGVGRETDFAGNVPSVCGKEAMPKTASLPEVDSEALEISTYEPDVSLVGTNQFFATIPSHKFSETHLEGLESATTDALKPMYEAAAQQTSTNTKKIVDLPQVTTRAPHEDLYETYAHLVDVTNFVLPNTDTASSLSVTIANNTEINNNSTNELATSPSPFVPEVIMNKINAKKHEGLSSEVLENSLPAGVMDLPIKAGSPSSVSNEGALLECVPDVEAAEILPGESISMVLVEVPAGSPVQVDTEDKLVSEEDGPERQRTCAEEALEKEQSHTSTEVQEAISQKLSLVPLADMTSNTTLEESTVTLDAQCNDSDFIALVTHPENANQENCEEEKANLDVKESSSTSAEMNGSTLSDYLEAREPAPPTSPFPDALDFVTAIEDSDLANSWESCDALSAASRIERLPLKSAAGKMAALPEERGFPCCSFLTADSSTAALESVLLERPHSDWDVSQPPPKPPRLFQESVLNEQRVDEYPQLGLGDEAETKHPSGTPKDSPTGLFQTQEVSSGSEPHQTCPSPLPSECSGFSIATEDGWEKTGAKCSNTTCSIPEDELSSGKEILQCGFSATDKFGLDLEENSDQSWLTSKSYFQVKELDTSHFAVWSADEENAIQTDSTHLNKALLMESSAEREAAQVRNVPTQPNTSTGSCSPTQSFITSGIPRNLNEESGGSYLDHLKGAKQQWAESVEPTWQSLPSISGLCSTVSQDLVTDLLPEDLQKPHGEEEKQQQALREVPLDPVLLPQLQPSNPFFGSDIGFLPKGIGAAVNREEELSHPPVSVNPKSSLFLHDCNPQASSTPSLLAETNAQLAFFPSPIPPHLPARPTTGTAQASSSTAPPSKSPPMIDTPFTVLPQETRTAASLPSSQQSSPHPVKPLTTAPPQEEKKSEGRSVLVSGLEKLKSTIHPGRAAQQGEPEADRNKALSEGAAPYYHLSHNELVSLLLQRETELERQGAEFERQGALLEKRETELRKMKAQTRDLEDYIDTLLVRIMEQTPTLLQVRTKLK